MYSYVCVLYVCIGTRNRRMMHPIKGSSSVGSTSLKLYARCFIIYRKKTPETTIPPPQTTNATTGKATETTTTTTTDHEAAEFFRDGIDSIPYSASAIHATNSNKENKLNTYFLIQFWSRGPHFNHKEKLTFFSKNNLDQEVIYGRRGDVCTFCAWVLS